VPNFSFPAIGSTGAAGALVVAVFTRVGKHLAAMAAAPNCKNKAN
jgi:hypothetical protein